MAGNIMSEIENFKGPALFQAILDAIPVPIFYKDIAYRYQGCNQAFLDYIGLTKEQILGRTAFDIAPTDLAEKYMEMDRKLFENPGKQSYEGSVVYAADKKRHDVVFHKATFRDADGNVIGLVGIMFDITERKQTEEQCQQTLQELKTTQQYVIRQERLSALGQMASGIAHDFNNSLTPIIGFADLLLQVPQQLKDLDRAKESIRRIKTAAQDAANTVKRLREFYRRRSNDNFQAVQLNKIVQETILLTEPLWKSQMEATGKKINIATKLETIPEFLSSPSELREILTNLILNAVDAIPQNGTITITTQISTQWAILTIADNGMGMSEEIKRRCLEPFFTTKGDKGSGLGLAVVYGIIQRHHGQLDIESKVGQGTSFTIRLPMQIPKEDNPKQPMDSPNFCMQVLIIDNNQNTSAVLQAYLTADYHSWQQAKNGQEALQKVQEHHFDMVIANQAVLTLNQDQLAIAIKQIQSKLPIIMIADAYDTFDEQLPAGVDWIIQRPLSFNQLREAILQARQYATNVSQTIPKQK